MNFEYLHEFEDVCFCSAAPRPCRPLWSKLEQMGFRAEHGVLYVPRASEKAIPPWQSDSLASVYFYRGQRELVGPRSQWDSLRLRYLLATQPRQGIPIFVEKAAEVARFLGLDMLFRSRSVGEQELQQALSSYCDELAREIGEAGSEEVAIFIQSTYPRRRT